MQIDIDKYLWKHRNKLDVEQPEDDRIWEGIRNDLHNKRRFLFSQFLRVSAIVLIFIGAGYIAQLRYKQNQLEKANLYAISKLLGRQEQNYIEKVNIQLTEIEKLTSKDDEIIYELLNELIFLDTIYNEAYSDLKKLGYKEEVVNIIFDTYEKRIGILEKIIVESQIIEKNEGKEHEIKL